MSLESIAGLLAFIVAVYALLIQNKKSQTALGTIFLILTLTGFGIFALASLNLINVIYEIEKRTPIYWGGRLDVTAATSFCKNFFVWLLSGGLFVLILGDISVEKYYRTDSWVVFKRIWYSIERTIGKHRDHSPVEIDETLLRDIFERFFYHQDEDNWEFLNRASDHKQSLSVLATKARRELHNREIAALIYQTLDKCPQTFIEYVSCTRHPAELIQDMISMLIEDKKCSAEAANDELKDSRISSRLLLIDAHTAHFGFEEPVYYAKSKEIEPFARKIIRSDKSFPGIHTALVKGFGEMSKSRKLKNASTSAPPLGIIIFDELSSLADIDSPEQFRLFIRHVVASEHLMGGILTIIYEPKTVLEVIPYLPNLVDFHFNFHCDHDVAFAPWEIAAGVNVVAREIANLSPLPTNGANKVLLFQVLQGGIVFAEAVIKQLKADPYFDQKFEVHTIHASKYGDGTTGYGKVEVKAFDKKIDLIGRTIVLLDDICHSGDTLEKLAAFLYKKKARNVLFAVAVERRNQPLSSFHALRFQDKYPNLPGAWMYGYGMDNKNDPESRKKPCFIFDKRR